MALIGQEYKFSPSQIDTFRSCERKWGWGRIAKVPRSQHPSAALGERCHKQLENYLIAGDHPTHQRDGIVDETGAMVEPSLHTLPPPGTVDVEHKFLFQSPRTGFLYTGRIDWRRRLPAEEIAAMGFTGEWAEVGDHKSTSNLAYAKSPTDLLTDPQGVIYAVDTMAHFMVPNVRLHWNYLSTKRPYRTLPVIQHVNSVGVAEEFKAVEATAETMARHLDTVGPGDILSLPANLDTCRAYGGCPYRFKCELSPTETLKSLWSNTKPPEKDTESKMGLLEEMRARIAVAKAGQAVAPGANAPVAMTAATSPVVASLQEHTAPPAPAPVLVQTAFGAAPMPAGQAPPEGMQVVQPGQINPPESSAPPTAEQLDAATRAAKAGDPESTSKRHRRTKAEMEAARAAEASGAAVITEAPSVPADAPVVQAPAAPIKGEPRAPIAILFIDCLPVKGIPFLDSAALIAEANRKVCEHFKAATGQEVSDYRYIDYKGGGMLAEAAVDLVRQAGNVVGLCLNSSTPEGKHLLNPLSAIAGAIVRGVAS